MKRLCGGDATNGNNEIELAQSRDKISKWQNEKITRNSTNCMFCLCLSGCSVDVQIQRIFFKNVAVLHPQWRP